VASGATIRTGTLAVACRTPSVDLPSPHRVADGDRDEGLKMRAMRDAGKQPVRYDMSAEELFEATCGTWKIGACRGQVRTGEPVEERAVRNRYLHRNVGDTVW